MRLTTLSDDSFWHRTAACSSSGDGTWLASQPLLSADTTRVLAFRTETPIEGCSVSKGRLGMSHKSKPGDGTQNNGTKGGGLYLRHHAGRDGRLRTMVDSVIGRLARS